MKNLLTHSEEFLDNLPSREKFEDHSWDSYWGAGMPWTRIQRWTEAQKGRCIDDVISDWKKLEWLLPIYRTIDELSRHIRMHTFWKEGRVFYHSDTGYLCFRGKSDDNFSFPIDAHKKCVYVHPHNRCVMVFKQSKTVRSYASIEREKFETRCKLLGDYHQLYKQSGIWYEVQAKGIGNIPRGISGILLLRNPLVKKKGPHDILLEGSSCKNANDPYVIITLKRQINSKELKKHGLKNG